MKKKDENPFLLSFVHTHSEDTSQNPPEFNNQKRSTDLPDEKKQPKKGKNTTASDFRLLGLGLLRGRGRLGNLGVLLGGGLDGGGGGLCLGRRPEGL